VGAAVVNDVGAAEDVLLVTMTVVTGVELVTVRVEVEVTVVPFPVDRRVSVMTDVYLE